MKVDVAIAGGGLVGAALGCALQGLKVAVIDGKTPADAPVAAAGFDSRIYAVSPGNARFLGEIGAWDRMPQGTATPVHAMSVVGDDGSSRVGFDAWDTGVPELAWIVEERQLQAALYAELATRRDVALLAPVRCIGIDFAPGSVALELEGGTRIDAKLLVGADGAQSFVRSQAGIEVRDRAYGQAAVVANFACERPHANVARQWFRGGPVLALLPLPGRHVSMVWSTGDEEARRIAALDAPALCAEVAQASGNALGALSSVTPSRVFPLRRLAAARLVCDRVALAGDAAHVVHPLAGQGVNLGFQDAKVLAGVLVARVPGCDPGDLALLRRYERARAEAILAMDATVHGLFGLFGAGSPLARRVRNAGLKLVDRADVLKNLLIRHAMQ